MHRHGKQFFFEKKNQKTFVLTVPQGPRRSASARSLGPARERKFFGSFFQKRTACLESGFTLIEVIVALVVLGFVLAGLGQATRFGMSAWGLETRMSDNAAGLERLDRVLRRLVEQAAPPAATDDKPFIGQEHRLVFTTTLPDEPQTQPIRRAQVAIGVDDRHRLVLRWQPHPHATVINGPPAQQEIVLAEGLERIDMAYRQSAEDGGKWSKAWKDSALPALVQIHFVLANGKHRWPDMVIPTMLDTNGSF